MNGHDAARALSALYGPSAEDLRRALPELADGLSAQLVELHKRPTPERAEMVARNLEGVRQHVMRYRERLVVEGVTG